MRGPHDPTSEQRRPGEHPDAPELDSAAEIGPPAPESAKTMGDDVMPEPRGDDKRAETT